MGLYTPRPAFTRRTGPTPARGPGSAALGALRFGSGLGRFGALAYVFSNANIPLANGAAPEIGDVTLALGQLLMGTFLLPFEIAGVLLLAAMIGAIVIAKET